MKKIFLASALFTFAVFSANVAFAFSVDDKSMSSSASAEHFSDPDERTPVYMQGGNKTPADSADPASIRYDYDSSTGTYVPHPAEK